MSPRPFEDVSDLPLGAGREPSTGGLLLADLVPASEPIAGFPYVEGPAGVHEGLIPRRRRDSGLSAALVPAALSMLVLAVAAGAAGLWALHLGTSPGTGWPRTLGVASIEKTTTPIDDFPPRPADPAPAPVPELGPESVLDSVPGPEPEPEP